MAWTTPKTFSVGAGLTASELNTHVRDNLNALKAPPTALINVNEAADYTTTSASFVDVDAVDLALSITTTGGDVLIGFTGVITHSAAAKLVYLDVHESVGNARLGGDDGIVFVRSTAINDAFNASFLFLARNLAAGAHVFKLQWKTTSATALMYAGAATSGADIHPQFFVREV
jgi:hypothetical protein